jgi:tetratricopeptide (TPR) repeat protein
LRPAIPCLSFEFSLKGQRQIEIMKRYFAFTLVMALTVSVSQFAHAQASKEANKLAVEGAEAAKDQEWDKAVELLRKATDLDHKYADDLSAVYQQRAYAAANNQQFQDAINDYSEAIKLKPEDARIYEQRAAVEMKSNNTEKALADYSEAIKLKPNEVRYYLYRSYIYETKGDMENSMADTEKILKLDPKNKDAQARKERLEKVAAMRAPLTPIPAPSPKASPTSAKKP